jgi:tRNA (guanine-N7-)-methyltransferase
MNESPATPPPAELADDATAASADMPRVTGTLTDRDGNPRARREVRSFVKRGGRATSSQLRAIEEQWPQLGIPAAAVGPIGADGTPPASPLLDFSQLFGRTAPVTLEIGFGDGEQLATLASLHPDRDYLGAEVHEPGVGHLLLRVEALGLTNVRVARHDAVELLRHQVPVGSLDEVLVYFPDPWHKKRHHKRRLIQPPFVELLLERLRIGGVFRLATDWEPYAHHMLEVLGAEPRLRNRSADGTFIPRPAERPITKFERRGYRLGHGTWDLAFERIA